MPAEHPSGLSDLGEFTFSRGEGNTTGDLTVYYMLHPSSTADKEVHYEEDLAPDVAPFGAYNYGWVTIGNGKSSVTLQVTPVNEPNKDDAESEWNDAHMRV